jgi:hypothetical protein
MSGSHPKTPDRRKSRLQNSQHWQAMSAEQKISLYKLQPFGYRLLFVRRLPDGPLAVIAQQNELATLSAIGELNNRPQIQLR